MHRRISPNDRSLRDLRSLLVVCRECGERKRLTRPTLGVLWQEGTRTLGMLRRRAVCHACDYGGLDPRNLRFHAQWMEDRPATSDGPANDNEPQSGRSSITPFFG